MVKPGLIVLVLACASSTAAAIDYDPDETALAKAIDYGKKSKGKDLDTFRREWFKLVGTGDNTVNFVITSPWYQAASGAMEAAQKYGDYSVEQAKGAAGEYKNVLDVGAVTRTTRGVIDDAVLVIKIGTNVVKPATKKTDCFEGGLCGIEARFESSEIPSDAKIVVVLIHKGREITARYDLKKVR